jgi:hypothetical protein
MSVDSDLDSESDPDPGRDERGHSLYISFMRLGAPPAPGGLSRNCAFRKNPDSPTWTSTWTLT